MNSESETIIQKPVLNEVFQELKENDEVVVNTEDMPVELESILEFVGEKSFVSENIDNIVFSLNKDFESSFFIDENESNVCINLSREDSIYNKKILCDELDIFDLVIYETKRVELFREGNLQNNDEIDNCAKEKQLEALKKFQKNYPLNPSSSANTYFYFAKKIQSIENSLR